MLEGMGLYAFLQPIKGYIGCNTVLCIMLSVILHTYKMPQGATADLLYSDNNFTLLSQFSYLIRSLITTIL